MQHKDKLTEQERIARRKETTARYREKNRDKCREATRKSHEKNPERKRAYNAEWKSTNEAYIQKQKEYRVANKDKLNAATVAWQKANQEHVKAYQKQWSTDNHDHVIEKSKIWRKTNSDRSRAQAAKWAKENPDLRRISAGARRARARTQVGYVSKDIAKKLMLLQRGKCAICNTDLEKSGNHLDHVMPLVLGGLHDDSNFQLLCPSCNLSKNAKHPVDFMQEKGFLL